jgi:predicted nucleotidyltransferase
MDQKLLLDLKWKKLKKLAKYFAFVPFLDFVVVTGSMAVGNVKENSDFDLLVSVKEGRMFTARYCINLIFSLLGKRRPDDLEETKSDKLCLNHFVTETTWIIKPINAYSTIIYRNWVPLWGNEEKIEKFLTLNSKYDPNAKIHLEDLRFGGGKKNAAARSLERLLDGTIGDFVEKNVAGAIAKRRLSRYLAKKEGNGRFILNEQELEFHSNPKK